MSTAAKKTTTPRRSKTLEDLENELLEAEKLAQKLRLKIAEDKIGEKIKNSGLVNEFKKLHEELDGSVSEIDLLAALGKKIGIVRLQVTQTPLKPRSRSSGESDKSEEKKS